MEILYIILTALLVVGVMLFLHFKKFNKAFKITMLVIGITFFVLSVARLFVGDMFLLVVNGGYFQNQYLKSSDYIVSFVKWFTFLSYAIVPMAIFYKSVIFKRLLIFFCLPATILALVYFTNVTAYLTDPAVYNYEFGNHFGQLFIDGKGFRIPFNVSVFMYAMELSMVLIVSGCILIKHYNVILPRSFKAVGGLILSILLTLFIMIPVWLPASLFGTGDIRVSIFTVGNFIWIGLTFAIVFVIYYLFRYKSYETRYELITFIAFISLFQYNCIFMLGLSWGRLPLQLCNVGSYMSLIAMVFKNKRIFHFTLIANVVGVFIAMTQPDADQALFHYRQMHFVYSHSLVFIIPIAAQMLRLFGTVEKSMVKNNFIIFSSYFLICMISGIIINFSYGHMHITVNYFYMFNSQVADVFTFVAFMREPDFAWVVNGYSVYPLYIITIYVGYSIFCRAFYSLLVFFEGIGKQHNEVKKLKYEEIAEITGKPIKKQIEYLD